MRRSPGSGSSPAGAFPTPPWGPVADAAGSPLTVAGAAPVSHRTSLSHRKPDASTPRGAAPCVLGLARGAASQHRQRAATRIAVADTHLGRAVDRDDAPAMAHAGPVDMVDAGHRAVFHR